MRRSSARSSRRWSTRSRRAATSSRGPSSTAAEGVTGTRGSRVDVLRTAHSFRPDVVYAHFLVPAGLLAALAGRAPLVVTAHGQDVENARRSRAVRAATQLTVRRAHAVVAVSAWLLDRLVEVVPDALAEELRDRLRRRPRASSRPVTPLPPGRRSAGRRRERDSSASARSASARTCSGSRARSSYRGEGELTFVGDGPLRGALEGRPKIQLAGTVDHGRVAAWIAAADVVCQPSLAEPFGLATLEGLASGRSVVATSVGGPPEFVPPDAGILVDPTDDDFGARGARCGGAAPASQPRGPERGRGARRQAAGGAGGGAPGSCCSFSRSASLISTSGRTVSSSPAAGPPRVPPRSSRAPCRATRPA